MRTGPVLILGEELGQHDDAVGRVTDDEYDDDDDHDRRYAVLVVADVMQRVCPHRPLRPLNTGRNNSFHCRGPINQLRLPA